MNLSYASKQLEWERSVSVALTSQIPGSPLEIEQIAMDSGPFEQAGSHLKYLWNIKRNELVQRHLGNASVVHISYKR